MRVWKKKKKWMKIIIRERIINKRKEETKRKVGRHINSRTREKRLMRRWKKKRKVGENNH